MRLIIISLVLITSLGPQLLTQSFLFIQKIFIDYWVVAIHYFTSNWRFSNADIREETDKYLIQFYTTCHRATKPVHPKCWAHALEPGLQLSSPCATTTEAWGPQSLCSATREVAAMRSQSTTTWEQPLRAATGESLHEAMKTQPSQK